MGKIYVVGTGPGSRDYLTPAAEAAVERADVLIGGRRALSLFDSDKPKKVMNRDLDGVISFIRENRKKRIAVLTSGDPGFYSILTKLLEAFPREDLEVIPGVSSMQLCFARMREPWGNAVFLSLHGRDAESIMEEMSDVKTLVFLLDSATPPQMIAKILLQRDMGDRRAVVGENLGSSNEKLTDATVREIAAGRFSGTSLMVVFHG
jgi:precorrin-6y C5,15-methyltransferase (decarboxylating) CbiE subunit